MNHCEFCGRPQNEVRKLIPGKTGKFICDRCIAAAAVDSQVSPTKGKKEEPPLPRPKEIKAYLDNYVISQDGTKVDMAIAVHQHYKRRDVVRKGLDLGVELQKSNILLMGPSGTGKTECARSLAKMLGVPFYVGDATKLTVAGYVGDDVESLLQGLLADCDNEVERAQWGIIFIDEFDKLARKSGRSTSGSRDISGEGAQQALLKMLEGSKVQVPTGGFMSDKVCVDTTNILFICAGSFAGIEEGVRRRFNKGTRLGFGAEPKKIVSEAEVYSGVKEEDILEFGIIPELLGRLPIITTTLPLTEDDMVRILTEPKGALVKQFQALFSLDDIKLTFTEESLRLIGKEASSRPTGARSLRGIVSAILKPYMFDWIEKEVNITEEEVKKVIHLL